MSRFRKKLNPEEFKCLKEVLSFAFICLIAVWSLITLFRKRASIITMQLAFAFLYLV